MRSSARHSVLAAAATLALCTTLAPVPAAAQAAAAPPDLATLMQQAERIGSGRVTAYKVGASTLLELPGAALGKPVLWYTEAVALPPGVVTDSLEAADSLVRLERHGNFVHVRDLGGTQKRRAATPEPPPVARAGAPGAVPGAAPRDAKRRPARCQAPPRAMPSAAPSTWPCRAARPAPWWPASPSWAPRTTAPCWST